MYPFASSFASNSPYHVSSIPVLSPASTVYAVADSMVRSLRVSAMTRTTYINPRRIRYDSLAGVSAWFDLSYDYASDVLSPRSPDSGSTLGIGNSCASGITCG